MKSKDLSFLLCIQRHRECLETGRFWWSCNYRCSPFCASNSCWVTNPELKTLEQWIEVPAACLSQLVFLLLPLISLSCSWNETILLDIRSKHQRKDSAAAGQKSLSERQNFWKNVYCWFRVCDPWVSWSCCGFRKLPINILIQYFMFDYFSPKCCCCWCGHLESYLAEQHQALPDGQVKNHKWYSTFSIYDEDDFGDLQIKT